MECEDITLRERKYGECIDVVPYTNELLTVHELNIFWYYWKKYTVEKEAEWRGGRHELNGRSEVYTACYTLLLLMLQRLALKILLKSWVLQNKFHKKIHTANTWKADVCLFKSISNDKLKSYQISLMRPSIISKCTVAKILLFVFIWFFARL